MASQDQQPLTREVLIGRTYRHYKGGLYVVQSLGRYETNCEPVVIYKPVGGDQVWVRTVKAFLEDTFDGNGEQRFVLVEDG